MNRRKFMKQTAIVSLVAGIAPNLGGIYPDKKTTIARVSQLNGDPQLFINDKPHIPLVFSCGEPTKEYISNFANNIGIHIHQWGSGTIIYGCSDLGWIGPDRYDYSKFDNAAQLIVDTDPDAYLLPRLAVSAPSWWLESHPDERLILEDGSFALPDFRAKLYETSMASELWLNDVSVALEKFLKHVLSMPYANRMLGYQLTGGSNEWFYYGSGYVGEGIPDFSPAAVNRFRKWLRAKYNNDIGALRDSWKLPDTEFETTMVPSGAERLKTDVNMYRNPAVSRRVIDYYEFHSDVVSEALVHLCRLGKKVTNNESLFGAFYGYIVNAAGGYTGGYARLHWGHQSLRRVLESKDIDFLASPYQYFHRGPGGYDGPQCLEGSARLHGKLFMVEVDTPTYTSVNGFYQGMPGVPKRSDSMAIMKRDFSHRMIVKGQGFWWTNLSNTEGWYQHPDIARLLARTRVLFEKSLKLDMYYKAEVAVFMDEESPFYVKPGSMIEYPQIFLQERLGLARMGTTCDMYLHNDLERDNMPDYKLYIFLDALYITSEERTAIKEKLRRENKVALWLYSPGLIDENGISEDNMEDLTGIRLKYHTVTGFVREYLGNRIYLSDFDHPITKDMPSNMYFGTETMFGPITYSDDPDVKVLGRLMPSHALNRALGEFPGFVVKKFENWTSIFISAPVIPSDLLRSIAEFAGCHVYNSDNDIVYANSHFLMTHTAKGGIKKFKLTKNSDVYDAFSEKLVARDVNEFSAEIPQYATQLYFLDDIKKISDKKTIIENL